MAVYTQNFKLVKPQETDFYNIEDFNGNADKIDKALKDLRDEARPIDKGGTGATTAKNARNNLEITPVNIGAAPASHNHKATDIVQDATHRFATDSEKNTWNGKANASHKHAIDDVANLQSTLDGKAPTSHKHAISDVNNLQATLDGKAAASHNHSVANITSGTLPITRGGTGGTTAAAARSALGITPANIGAAPASHTHSIGNITNLQSALDGKATSSHTHTKSQVGLANVDNVKQYSANNPPPYPVTKVNGKTGAVSLNHVDVGAVQNGGVEGQDGDHQMAMSWNGSRIIVGIDNNAAVKKVLTDGDITGAVSNVIKQNFNANRVIVSNAAGKSVSSPITVTELNHLDGLTAGVQYQLNRKISFKKVWSNAAPTSAFAPQTLNIDFTGYELIMIVAKISTSGNRTTSVIVPFVSGKEAFIDFAFDGGAAGPSNYHRTVKITSPGPQFLVGNYSAGSSSTTGNEYVIPIEIYSIDGVVV